MENSLPPRKLHGKIIPRKHPHQKIPPKISLCFPATNTIWTQWAKLITCSPSPGAVGGQVILRDIVIRSFNHTENNTYIKILIRQFWLKKRGVGRGCSCPRIFLVILKGNYNFLFPIKCALSRYSKITRSIRLPLGKEQNKKQISTHP